MRLLPLVLLASLASCDRGSSSPARSGPGPAPGASGGAQGSPSPGPREGPPGPSAAPSTSPLAVPEEEDRRSPDGDEEVDLRAALLRLEAEGRVDLDMPLGMHLPLMASPRTGLITPRQLMEHTAHLGGRAYEDFLRANPGADGLKAQAFIVALGSDDTPGQRPSWRRAHVDLMGWLVTELTP